MFLLGDMCSSVVQVLGDVWNVMMQNNEGMEQQKCGFKWHVAP